MAARCGDGSGAFEAAQPGPREALRRSWTGPIALSGFETGGERLQTAHDPDDQEDERSCSTDEHAPRHGAGRARRPERVTRRCARLDRSIDAGAGLHHTIAEQDDALAEEVDARIDERHRSRKASPTTQARSACSR